MIKLHIQQQDIKLQSWKLGEVVVEGQFKGSSLSIISSRPYLLMPLRMWSLLLVFPTLALKLPIIITMSVWGIVIVIRSMVLDIGCVVIWNILRGHVHLKNRHYIWWCIDGNSCFVNMDPFLRLRLYIYCNMYFSRITSRSWMSNLFT